MTRYPLYEFSKFEFYFNIEEIEGVQYRISFSSSAHFLPVTLLEADIYEISFSKIGELKISDTNISERIKLTISFAITSFINKNVCPILFICESIDGREQCRLKLFNSWYNNLEGKENYTFEARELYSEAEDFTYYSGIIIPNNHNHLIEMLDEFDSPEIFEEKLKH